MKDLDDVEWGPDAKDLAEPGPTGPFMPAPDDRSYIAEEYRKRVGELEALRAEIAASCEGARNEAFENGRIRGLEEAARISREYAHLGSTSMMRRQVCYAIERRILEERGES